MIAILHFAFFATATALALASIVQAHRTYRHRFAELRDELRVADQGIAVRYTWRELPTARPTATVYQLGFTPKADCLPFHPEHELRVAA